MKKTPVLALSLIIFLSSGRAWAQTIRDSVVKIYTTANSIDYYRPWQSTGSNAITGSGVIVGGDRILTNAHVVADNTFIQVRKESDPQKYAAKVETIGYDCDLAVLKVDDPKFFEKTVSLEYGDLPQLQDSVIVIGFPLGGDKISITEGVVSRIEIIPYALSASKLLGVQIDAAINPGNSGGAVIQNGKLVGIAMQVINNSQNIGFMIPTPIIHHFLNDLKDGGYGGFPLLGIEFLGTENKSLREFYGLQDEQGGVIVSRTLPFSASFEKLKEGDVILAVDDTPIGVDGTFEFRPNERLVFSHLINNKQIGDNIRIKILRDKKISEQAINLKSFVNLVPFPHHFDKPPYYIYGGLIFTVLTTDLLRTFGGNWWEKAPLDFLYYLIGHGRMNEKSRNEIVVLLEVLPDAINIGHHDESNQIIARVNGQEFSSFKEFISLLENNKNDFTIVETEDNQKIIIRNKGLPEINEAILERNNIPAPFSEDVARWLGELSQ